MLKILMFYSAYGFNYPQAKDIMKLSRYFATNNLAQVNVLTRIGKIETRYDEKDTQIRFFTLKHYNDLMQACDIMSEGKPSFVKFFYKLKRCVIEKIWRKNNYKDIYPFFEIKKFVRKHKNDKYDAIISFSNPFFIQKYAAYVFDKLAIKKWIPYILDPYADHCKSSDIKAAVQDERKLFEKAYAVYTFKEFVDKAVFSPCKEYLDKIRYVPVHIMENNCTNGYSVANDKTIRLCFCGQLIDDLRNPGKLLKAFLLLPETYRLQFYSKGCETQIEYYRNIAGDRIASDGFITKSQEYSDAIKRHNILISIGNTVDNQIPSKVYDYCSYGKPIIHFLNSANDPVKDILKAYPLVKFIDYAEDCAVIAEEIKNFAESTLGESVPYDKIREIFDNCLVETIGQKLLKDIQA